MLILEFELYRKTEYHSTDIKNVFSHDDLKDSGAYSYFLKLDSTKTYFYAFRFRVDQNNNIIAVVIEPIPMKYWSEDSSPVYLHRRGKSRRSLVH